MVWRSLFVCRYYLIMMMLLAAHAVLVSIVSAQDPLRVRIDQLIVASGGSPTGTVSDEEFARRLYLDLTGAVPSAAEVKSFLADPSVEKKTLLVDRLLASPQYARHMATTFDVMLMERRPEKHVKRDEFHRYLLDSFAQNKPWNQLAREILGADGTDERIRPAARFYLDREGEPNALTRDVGRMFFGMDLGCCQCHDHPLVNSYLQSDYYGIYAFLSRGALITDKDKKVFYAERAEGDVKFTSVFTKKQDEMRPRLPGEFEITEPLPFKGEDYLVPPADGIRSVPTFSRRARLAELISSGSNRQFTRNIVNRLWALLLGRGLVEPVDMHHVDNPPSNPELLEALADEFVRMNFDIRALLREVALSQTYQRPTSLSPETNPTQATELAQQIQALETEYQQKSESLATQSAAIAKSREEYESARKAVIDAVAEFNKSNESIAAANKTLQDANKSLAEAQQQLAAKQQISISVQSAAKQLSEVLPRLVQDNRLVEATEKFNARASQLAGEVAAAEKVVADRAPPVQAATDAVTAAKNAAAMTVQKVSAAEQNMAPMRERLGSLLQAYRTEQVAADSIHSKLDLEKAPAESRIHELSMRFVMPPLEPLTPEQMAWSVFKVTGVLDQQRAAAEAELNKAAPMDPAAMQDPAKKAEREKLLEQSVYDKQKGYVDVFISLFGHAGGQPQRDFFATVDQALFFANGGVLQSWLQPSGDNLVGRAVNLSEPNAVAEELYFGILTRHPTGDEVSAVTDYLANRPTDRAVAIQEIAWALITSTEFRFQ